MTHARPWSGWQAKGKCLKDFCVLDLLGLEKGSTYSFLFQKGMWENHPFLNRSRPVAGFAHEQARLLQFYYVHYYYYFFSETNHFSRFGERKIFHNDLDHLNEWAGRAMTCGTNNWQTCVHSLPCKQYLSLIFWSWNVKPQNRWFFFAWVPSRLPHGGNP